MRGQKDGENERSSVTNTRVVLLKMTSRRAKALEESPQAN